jgi:hypothetical protein
VNGIQVWNIDGMMLAAENEIFAEKTFVVPLFSPQRLVDNCLNHDM